MIRGEIWWANFGIPYGSEPGFNRPVLIMQADAINRSTINTTLVVPLTTNLSLAEAPGNVFLDSRESLLSKDSVLVVAQLSVLDKKRLVQYESSVGQEILDEVERGIKIVLDLK
jgi:mRNA interferase MazF